VVIVIFYPQELDTKGSSTNMLEMKGSPFSVAVTVGSGSVSSETSNIGVTVSGETIT